VQRLFISEEYQSWKTFDSIFFGDALIFRGHKYNTAFVQLIIYVLKTVEDLIAFFAFLATSAYDKMVVLIIIHANQD